MLRYCVAFMFEVADWFELVGDSLRRDDAESGGDVGNRFAKSMYV